MGIESDKEIRLRKYLEENEDCRTGDVFKLNTEGV